MAVLIIAPATDDHAPEAARQIEELGVRAEILDLASYPATTTVSMQFACCGRGRRFTVTPGAETPDERWRMAEFGSVWWRRPAHPRVSDAVTSPSHRAFAANEASEALAGLWYALGAYWVNDPSRDDMAQRKGYQLKVAQDIGLQIPRTLMTNDVGDAREFIDAVGYHNVVFKTFSSTQDQWRETRLLGRDELALIDDVRHAPVIFQKYVPAQYDLRVTVMGDTVFPVAIHSQQTDYPVDSRIDFANARVEPVDLPPSLTDQLIRFTRRLGLVYGAIDLRLTPDGDYVLLEINPAGQFRYLEVLTGLQMTATLARLLVDNDRFARRTPAPRPAEDRVADLVG